MRLRIIRDNSERVRSERSKGDERRFALILRYPRSPLISDLFDTVRRKSVKRADDNRQVMGKPYNSNGTQLLERKRKKKGRS